VNLGPVKGNAMRQRLEKGAGVFGLVEDLVGNQIPVFIEFVRSMAVPDVLYKIMLSLKILLPLSQYIVID
jgi:hypothetical protein